MPLPYNENVFNQLQADLQDTTKKIVTVILSDLFNEDIDENLRKALRGAIERVARRKGIRTIVRRDTGKLSVMEFYRYDFAD